MARPTKTGLDYFPLDVDMDNDDKIALIEAKYGLTGFAIIIKMLMKIYDNSYFYEWTEKEQLLFSKRVNVDINLLNDVINDCLKWGLFNEKVYKSAQILTSRAIQERYLEASSRRKRVEIPRNHLLIDSDRVNVYKNLVIVDINNRSDELMYEKSTQSKVKESKVKSTTTTREEKNPENDAIVFYQNNLGVVRPAITEELLVFIKDFGDELVIEALKRAINRNKPNWGYAKSILQDWGRKGINTIEQAKAEEVEFQNQQQQRRPSYKQSSRKGIVPEWYEEQKKKHEEMLQQEPKSKEEIEEKQKELDSFFSQFQ